MGFPCGSISLPNFTDKARKVKLQISADHGDEHKLLSRLLVLQDLARGHEYVMNLDCFPSRETSCESESKENEWPTLQPKQSADHPAKTYNFTSVCSFLVNNIENA
ncbi:RING-type domain-containing protein [Psidium guajava]|nr:RING-type domain-containing protein [Psidium guajava]